MAIQHRRGIYSRFDPTRLVAGEWAIVLSGDTSASDGMAAYICFAAGTVKRVATFEDMAENIAAANEQLIQQLTTELTTNLNTAATRANDAADRCGGGEDARVAAEATRVSDENARVSAESTRVSHENARVSAEQTRVSNESARVSAESARASAEQTRIDNEEARVAAELLRASAETTRIDNETARTTAEATRIDNESGRVSAEQGRVEAEQGRVEAEGGRVTAEAARVAAFALIEQKIATRFRHMCGEGEYDEGTREPIISQPDPLTRYFVPSVHPTSEDQWIEWEWDTEGSRWEKIGTTEATFSPITTDKIDSIFDGSSVAGNEVLSATGLSYLIARLAALLSPANHRHSAGDIESGIMAPTRLPLATASEAEAGTSLDKVLTPATGKAAFDRFLALANKANSSHTHTAKEVIGLASYVYPVGAIYMSVSPTDPGKLFGGTWVSLGDRFLIGQSAAYPAGTTGGSTTYTPRGTVGGHVLTVGEIPSHCHNTGQGYWSCAAGTEKKCASFERLTSDPWTQNITSSMGGGAAHNHPFTGTKATVLPPYLSVYMWKRTA